MAGSLNKVVLIGNVGGEPVVRKTSDGRDIVNFSLATSESWKDKVTGEKKEKTEWHRIVIFNESLANVAKNYIKKGSKVYLEGSMQTRKWLDQSNVEKYTTEIVLQGYTATLILLDNKNNGDNDANIAKNSTNFDHSELDDEIPF